MPKALIYNMAGEKLGEMELPSRYPNTYNQLMACPDTEEGAYSAGYIIGRGYEVAGEDYANQGGYRAQELYRR